LKGALMLPFIVPLAVLGVLVSNMLALPMWLDSGFLAIR
jgi:hypothetical protein